MLCIMKRMRTKKYINKSTDKSLVSNKLNILRGTSDTLDRRDAIDKLLSSSDRNRAIDLPRWYR